MYYLSGVASQDAVPTKHGIALSGMLSFNSSGLSQHLSTSSVSSRWDNVRSAGLEYIDSIGKQGILVSFAGRTTQVNQAFNDSDVNNYVGFLNTQYMYASAYIGIWANRM